MVETRAEETAKEESFDLKRHAVEGIEEALFWHTVGILTDAGNSIGTGVAIRFNGSSLIVTANHVVKDTPDWLLRFYFRTSGTIKRSDWHQNYSPPGRYDLPQPVQILRRYSNAKDDLAAIVVPREIAEQFNVKFFDLAAEAGIPKSAS